MEPVRAAAAADLFKDPYVLDFVEIAEDAYERHLEKALTDRIKDLLLELGKGFSFMGSQYHLDVAGQDYYLDLLFYHTRLHSYVVIDLKMGEFEPEFAGKVNFYLAAVDDRLRTSGDNPSIGLILCRGKNGLIVEYALRDLTSLWPCPSTPFYRFIERPVRLSSNRLRRTHIVAACVAVLGAWRYGS